MFVAAKKSGDAERLMPNVNSSGPTTIAPGLTIEGDLVSSGEVRIGGGLVGDVKAQYLVITQSGSVKGTIVADRIEVAGQFEGKVSGRDITLVATARATGIINAAEVLCVEPGASFEGQVKRVKKEPKAQNGAARSNGSGPSVKPVKPANS